MSNVVSILYQGVSYQGGFWAIKRDGTVDHWGSANSGSISNIVASLHDISSIAAIVGGCMALKTDGTVLGFRFDQEISPRSLEYNNPDVGQIRPVRIHGEVLSNVTAIASFSNSPLILKNDGTVLSLNQQRPKTYTNSEPLYLQYPNPPYEFPSFDPVIINGQILSNVVAISADPETLGHVLALKKDGTVVAWGNNTYGAATVPAGLTNVIAIAAAPRQSLALKRDGTVAAWGEQFGHISVPAGMSNVIAITAGGGVGYAVITGSPPASVFIKPHGWIEEMTAEADLVFKGQVLSSDNITNSAFGISFLRVNATKFKLISVLTGNITTNEIVFQHYSGRDGRGGSWGGPPPPAFYKFETGQSYLVFAAKMDKPDRYYSVLPANTNNPDEFRQPMTGSFAIHTMDARPLNNLSIKEAVAFEQKLILDNNQTNQIPVQK